MDSGTRIFAPFLRLPVSLVTLKAAYRYIDYHVYFLLLAPLALQRGFSPFFFYSFQSAASIIPFHSCYLYVQSTRWWDFFQVLCLPHHTALMWADLVNKLSRCSYISTLASSETPGGKLREVSFTTQSWASTLLSTTFTPQSLMNCLLT